MRNNHKLPNLSGMLIFSHVVEAGSFTAAADRMGVSKATVSREIAQLEAELGAQLLRRTTRRMSLTEVGDVFHAHCQRVIEEAEAAEHSVSQLQAEPQGSLRIAVPMSFGHLVIAPLLPRFLERYPGMQVQLEATDRIIDLVHERIDVSIRIGRPQTPSYVLRRLTGIRAIVVGSPAYLEQHGAPKCPTDLLAHNCLGYRGPTETWTFEGNERVETQGNLSIDNGDGLLGAALEGLGLVYLPTYLMADEIRAGRLTPVLTDYTTRYGNAYAVYPESRHLSPKVRALIDWLADELGPEPSWDRDLPVPTSFDPNSAALGD